MDKGNLWSRNQLCPATRAEPKSVWFTPVIASDTAEARRYLLRTYGPLLHPKIRAMLRAQELYDQRRR